MANLGFSFQPGSQSIDMQSGGTRSGATASRQSGPQSAVEVKRLSLPNRFVPGEIAPQALLQSPGGGGQLNTDILRQLMQAFAPAGQQPGVPSLGGLQPSGMSFGNDQRGTPLYQVPSLPSGGDTGNTSGWNDNEHGLNRPNAPLPPAMDPGGVPQNPGSNPSPWSPAPPRIIPGDDGRRPPVQEPGGLPVPSGGDYGWTVPGNDPAAPGPSLAPIDASPSTPPGFDFGTSMPEQQNNWFQNSPFWDKNNDVQGFF